MSDLQRSTSNFGKWLLLFDIDGTLILSGGAGEVALQEGMVAAFGRAEGFEKITIAGSTDQAIIYELLQLNDIETTPGNIAKVLDYYLQILEDRLPKHTGRVLPGIVKLLEIFHAREDCVLGLLTGNIRRGAQLKLEHYGVWHFFEFGAFGDDHCDRNKLGPFALARAGERHGGADFLPERTFVLGDTPRDIECAKAIKAWSVAIATGRYSVDELALHEPDFIFKDLSDAQLVAKNLLFSAWKKLSTS